MTEIQKGFDVIFADLNRPTRESFVKFICNLASTLQLIIDNLGEGKLKTYLSIVQQILKLLCDHLSKMVSQE